MIIPGLRQGRRFAVPRVFDGAAFNVAGSEAGA